MLCSSFGPEPNGCCRCSRPTAVLPWPTANTTGNRYRPERPPAHVLAAVAYKLLANANTSTPRCADWFARNATGVFTGVCSGTRALSNDFATDSRTGPARHARPDRRPDTATLRLHGPDVRHVDSHASGRRATVKLEYKGRKRCRSGRSVRSVSASSTAALSAVKSGLILLTSHQAVRRDRTGSSLRPRTVRWLRRAKRTSLPVNSMATYYWSQSDWGSWSLPSSW